MGTKRLTFRREELVVKNDSEEEQGRSRRVFDELKEVVKAGGEMSEYEKYFRVTTQPEILQSVSF